MLENLRLVTGELYPLVFAFMVIIVMIFLTAIYAAIRVDRLWSLLKKQHDIEEIKKEVKADLKNP